MVPPRPRKAGLLGPRKERKERKKGKSLSCVQLLATSWTIAYQGPLSMGFPRQEYWSGLPFPSPGDLPNPGIKLGLPCCGQTLYPLSHHDFRRLGSWDQGRGRCQKQSCGRCSGQSMSHLSPAASQPQRQVQRRRHGLLPLEMKNGASPHAFVRVTSRARILTINDHSQR